MSLLSNYDGWEWTFNAGDERLESANNVIVDEMTIPKYVGHTLDDIAADLIELVAAVHLADRGSRRPPAKTSGDSWSRKIYLKMGVRDPDHWRDAAVYNELLSLLRWLTDDDWFLDFVPRIAPKRRSERIQFLFECTSESDTVALFSGGLDSLAGLAADIERNINPLAVSIKSNSRLAKSQNEVLTSLDRVLGTSIGRVPINLHLSKTKAIEESQRARGFGFLALACVVAATCGMQSVRVYENGIGSINLPYTAAQTGAQGTRAMNPKTLITAEKLFSRILDSPISIVNPSQYMTKAEMCAVLPISLHPTISLTLSCDTAFADRTRGPHNCGYCTSCLLRRQALVAAGLSQLDLPYTYQFDVFAESDYTAKKLYNFRAMLSQAARLERISRNTPEKAWPRIVEEYPDIIYALEALSSFSGDISAKEQLTKMLSSYAKEWTAINSPLVASYLN